MDIHAVEDAVNKTESHTALLASSGVNYGGIVAAAEAGDGEGGSSAGGSSSDFEGHHGTTTMEAFANLFKGYFGAGMLSLPWALSQLGVYYGCFFVFLMSFWSSYNCWTVVKLKRFIERQQDYNLNQNNNDNANNSNNDTGSVHSGAASAASSRTNLTFGDVGDWAYGTQFQSYVSACVCAQQLAICTVFISFIGENLKAVLDFMNIGGIIDSHVGVMTLCLPCVMSLSFLPSIKLLTPFMVLGTVLLGMCIGLIGVIMGKEWDARPDELPQLHVPQMPLAACAILYSYEGICLILPIESSMNEPKHFQKVFIGSMSLVATILAAFAAINVYIFGNVTSGSITAFLLEAYRDDPKITWYLMAANTAVSLSVLLSYPLQLFPALELIGTTKFARWIGGIEGPEDDDEEDLSGFDPLPALPEHDEYAEVDSMPSEHLYGMENENEDKDGDDDDEKSIKSQSTFQSVTAAIFPKMIMPGDSAQLRGFLVSMTYLVAVAVPNVQALISLVGALAGSSTALLIPPILELAWIHTLEEHRAHKTNREIGPTNDDDDADPTQSLKVPGSPFSIRRQQKTRFLWCGGKYWFSKIKCYFLFIIGMIFAGIGTYASLMDIIRIYRSGDN